MTSLQELVVWPLSRIGRLVLLLAILLLVVDGCCLNTLMFHPPACRYSADAEGYHDIGTNGTHVAAFLFEPENGARKVILWCHGNAEDLAMALPPACQFTDTGIAVAGVDYPGYGLSDGSPSEEGCYEAVHRLYDWLVETKGYKPSDIIVFGFSIGTGPALELATTCPVGGLILQAPFLSATRVVTRVRIMPIDPFQNINRIADVNCPLLILHGEADAVVPYAQGKKLFTLAPEPKAFISVPGANHNNLAFVYGIERYYTTLRSFINENTKKQ